ncbi:MAG: L,D-transpeptidase [Chromatiales bacterium 21-64-14]|nr:MAG: L,D-transpeptidase [Chromatiales bacterium 21-64-14]
MKTRGVVPAALRACALAGIGIALTLGGAATRCRAASFPYPSGAANVVGHIRVVTARADTTLLDIARHYDVGYNEIVGANPDVNPWLPGAGTRVVVPTEYVLPPKPWVGIIVNLPARRLFYFPPVTKRNPVARVYTFPVGIFQHGWPDPLGRTRIVAKQRMPRWVVPEDIRLQHARQGDPLPKVVPPGPENPMGELALQTGFPEIYIHGTSRPWGVGMRPSHGCFHLFPEDAVTLFRAVRVGTPVRIIDAPDLVGQRSGITLYLETFPPLHSYQHGGSDLQRTIDAITAYMVHTGQHWSVDWSRVRRLAGRVDSLPTPVSVGSPTLHRILAAVPAQPYGFLPYGVDANSAAPPPDVTASAGSSLRADLPPQARTPATPH